MSESRGESIDQKVAKNEPLSLPAFRTIACVQLIDNAFLALPKDQRPLILYTSLEQKREAATFLETVFNSSKAVTTKKERTLATLTPKQMEVLKKLYGLESDPVDLLDLADEMHFNQNTIRQIKTNGLMGIRAAVYKYNPSFLVKLPKNKI